MCHERFSIVFSTLGSTSCEWSLRLHLGAAWSVRVHTLLILWVETSCCLSAWRQSREGLTSRSIVHHHVLIVIACEAFLASSIEVSLSVILRKVIWIYHWKHLGEALSNSGDSLGWVSERQLAPRLEGNRPSLQVDDVFGAWCARDTTEGLLSEHSIVFLVIVSFAHEQIVHIL